MKALFTTVQQIINQQQACMLITVIAGSGSTPRGAGAKMAVFADGSSVGTIGGGALEYRVQQMAQEALQQKTDLYYGIQTPSQSGRRFGHGLRRRRGSLFSVFGLPSSRDRCFVDTNSAGLKPLH